MNTTKMAELSEVISSIAIIITLIFLVFEIRSNTDEVRENTLANIAGRTQEFTNAHMTNPQVDRVWNQMLSSQDLSTSDSELARSFVLAH